MASNSTALFEHISLRSYSIEGRDDKESYYPGCQCKSCSPTLCNCIFNATQPAAKPIFTDGLLNIEEIHSNTEYTLPIYECNSKCICDSSCVNRVTQKGGVEGLEVFSTENRGLGLRTNKHIPTGIFVAEFVGEVVRVIEAKTRLEKLTERDPCFIIVLKEHAGDSKTFITCIDATLKGNESRFINHSCEPNLIMLPVRINSVVPHLCLFSGREIAGGEEVTYDYGGGSDVMPSQRAVTCLCDSLRCKGFLPFQDI